MVYSSNTSWRDWRTVAAREIRAWQDFFRFLRSYSRKRSYIIFSKFEVVKDILVDLLYRKRGRYARPFLHLGTLSLVFAAILLGPVIFAKEEQGVGASVQGTLAAADFGGSIYTQQAEEVRQFRGGEIITHIVNGGETVSAIAQRYGLQPSTILWENNLTEKSKLKPGQELKILPVDGIRHKVQKGETIYTVAKRYGLDQSQAQSIIDYPFNEFLNDDTFQLATGQWLMVPDGEAPKVEGLDGGGPVARRLLAVTPDAGAVAALGSFLRPAFGMVTQGFKFYHKGIDIANRAAGPIVAADSGTVVVAGWTSSGYGNHIIIDHGNGFQTLYGHLSAIQVAEGQRVKRGDLIGQMGSTGRSTGTHLHFEIRQGGVFANPLVSLGLGG